MKGWSRTPRRHLKVALAVSAVLACAGCSHGLGPRARASLETLKPLPPGLVVVQEAELPQDDNQPSWRGGIVEYQRGDSAEALVKLREALRDRGWREVPSVVRGAVSFDSPDGRLFTAISRAEDELLAIKNGGLGLDAALLNPLRRYDLGNHHRLVVVVEPR